jgi:ABC-type antimicrobial peptide transport system permease subunit
MMSAPMFQANNLLRVIIAVTGGCVGFGLGWGTGVFVGRILDWFDPKHYLPGALVSVPFFALLGLICGFYYCWKLTRRAS